MDLRSERILNEEQGILNKEWNTKKKSHFKIQHSLFNIRTLPIHRINDPVLHLRIDLPV